jgi:transposase
MNFSKPYVKDYRRPDNAEEILEGELRLTYKYLTEAKGYSLDDIAIGFVDESSPQLTANTVRVWSFGQPKVRENTQKMKANTVGFYSLKGKSVREFTLDSKAASFAGFLEKVREENSKYKAVIVVLDNFPTHKSKSVREKAEEMGIYLVYLPPYSPDLNPIEFIWKSIRRVISLSFVKCTDGLKQIVGYSFDALSRSLSFARSWVEKVLTRVIPCYAELCV